MSAMRKLFLCHTPHSKLLVTEVGGGNALISFFSMKAIMKFIFNRLTVVM